jgi:hypothetical protein
MPGGLGEPRSAWPRLTTPASPASVSNERKPPRHGRVTADTQHRIKVLRLKHFDACPDAQPPAPRRQQRGSGHDSPRLPSSRNRLSGKDIKHTAERLAHFAYRRFHEQTESLTVKVKITKRGKTIPHNRQTPVPPIPNHVRMQSNYQQSQIRTGCPSFVP